ncbi:3-hydroxyisobutyrate dehydrogenase [Agrobacterium tumefaciens]|uniref:3-hydroxyisobutyrate dehydrogenase n=1 Tax=Agrobacterium tumefaciens TaxID=358 RepID=UPI0015733C99|nr:3-hydroxyisobutyrate dehydrogenase [Agrobacterium tumefaciens]NTB94891.1 3-hydroxyisobutyrate dehydrogenase [Agrobacterium tumefaciens]NTC44012.1 3-hydroxyisobutyrate dehydrogenase [Agrobacterium tumefaciens]
MAKIGFIGLGNMGLPMAANLVKAGYRVCGFDISSDRRELAAAAAVEIAEDITGVARGVDAVITMLNNGHTVLEIWDTIAPLLGPGCLLIDSSTIDIVSSRKAHALSASMGLLSLDAPVSGGTEGAAGASLTFMVGGSEEAFNAGQQLLSSMGRRVIFCGGAGAGVAAKICNNMLLGVSMVAVSETFLLAETLGLSPQSLFDVASTSSGQCYALTTHCPIPGPVPSSAANCDYRPGFAAELMLKDLLLSQECARSSGAPTLLGATATQLYDHFVNEGGRGFDYAAIIRFLGRNRHEVAAAP